MPTPPVTRFAPSPTGRLHHGHALAAKVAHDLARKGGGTFLLRHEDIDTTRSRPEYLTGIEDDLRWLGLTWDGEPLLQTTRTHAYEAALAQLTHHGMVYPCFCTRREIIEETSRIGGAPHGPEGPVYPGTCKTLTKSQREERLAIGTPHSWRLDSTLATQTTGPLTFSDLIHGTHPVDPDLLGDVILARKDIGTAYHLAVVVDDAYQQITHVTRGDDLLPSTHVHRILQALLSFPEPLYLHHRLLLDDQGKRLAKRHDSLAIATLRQSGISPTDVLKLCQ
jgi:glutamyl-Q tRNA(Asp) synthetase